jgi:hypothetical protein
MKTGIVTFLSYQTLSSGRKANHNNTDSGLWGLDAAAVSLPVRTHHLAFGHFAHLGLVLLARFRGGKIQSHDCCVGEVVSIEG